MKESLMNTLTLRVVARFERILTARYKEKKKVRSEDGGMTTVYLYSDRAIAERNKNKAERLEKLRGKIHKLTAQVKKDLKSEDPDVCLVALAIACIQDSSERVGNEASARGEKNDSGKPHVGVTGWKKSHISFKNGTAILNYIGKSGIKQHKVISDKAIVSALKNAYEGCTEDSLFSYEGGRVDARKVNSYLDKFGVTAKDLRGLRANEELIKALKAIRSKGGKLPEDKKEREEKLKKEFDTAVDEVADILGNEAKTLASQYLVPGLADQFKSDGTVLEKLTEALNAKATKQASEEQLRSPSTHYRVMCSNCGTVLRQCRCYSCDKTIFYEECSKCKEATKHASEESVVLKWLEHSRMVDWFEKRTILHINLVQKYCRKIEDYDPIRFAGLSEQAKDHDQSKYEEPEREPYVYITWQYYCKDHGKKFDAPKDLEKQMSKATEHHVKANPHHPEYHSLEDVNFINREDRDKPPDKIVDATKMPDMDIAEMSADWMAMSDEKGTKPKDWADKNVNVRWKFTPEQVDLIYELLELFPSYAAI